MKSRMGNDEIEDIRQTIEIQEALQELIDEGLVEMRIDEDGEPVFRLTEKGARKAEEIIAKMAESDTK